MGFYRLCLALLVALSHIAPHPYGYNLGVVAVISFYILSGYVMTLLIEKYYKQPVTIPTFYMDRVARLFPQFLFYMIIYSVFIYYYKINNDFTYNLTLGKWILNFLMIPQGFFMYWAHGALVNPPTWSLGLEMTFYFVIPWIIIFFSTLQIYITAFFSFLIFIFAYFGFINTDNFGYRLLPGTLFIFLIGWSFFKNDTIARLFRTVIFISVGLLFIALFFNRELYEMPNNKEVLSGLLLGMSAVSFIKNFSFSKIDEFWGNLSYGIFLNHFIIYWLMLRFFAIKSNDVGMVILLLLVSGALSLGSYYLVERPVLKWRHLVRNRLRQKKIKYESGVRI